MVVVLSRFLKFFKVKNPQVFFEKLLEMVHIVSHLWWWFNEMQKRRNGLTKKIVHGKNFVSKLLI